MIAAQDVKLSGFLRLSARSISRILFGREGVSAGDHSGPAPPARGRKLALDESAALLAHVLKPTHRLANRCELLAARPRVIHSFSLHPRDRLGNTFGFPVAEQRQHPWILADVSPLRCTRPMDKNSTFDPDFDFRSDTPPGADPDAHSLTLANYHRLLWSKALPNGEVLNFSVEKGRSGYLIRQESELGTLVWSSDTISNSHKGHRRALYDQMPPGVNDEHHRARIGARVVFPALQLHGKHTVNQARGGFNSALRDRFDLALECIRRYYEGDGRSPLADTLERYARFFDLFGSFRGYVSFFLLEDLVSDDFTAVRFHRPFEQFGGDPLPRALDDYVLFRKAQAHFIAARTERIKRWVRQYGETTQIAAE